MKSRPGVKLGNLCRVQINLIDQPCSRTRAAWKLLRDYMVWCWSG
uniref:Uncharacterized protein n=1 Tax=Arundo donax TaxID=35708 RepID=A0A0A9DXC3_ARUDO